MDRERPWMESLIACVPDGLAFVHEDWRILWTNEGFARLTGLADAPRDRSMAEFVEDWPAVGESLLYGLRHGRRSSRDVMLTGPGGPLGEACLHLARCRPEVPAAFAIHLRDRRELAELTRELAERERSHSFLRSNISDLIVRTDAELRVTWRNTPAVTLFPADGRLLEIVSPVSMDALAPVAAGAPGGPPRIEVELESAPGRRPVFYLKGIVRRLTDDSGSFSGISMILRDAMENRRLAWLASRLGLSAREQEVVEYLVQGYSNLNIASILGLSESGVKFHIRNVLGRAQVNTRTELMALLLSE